MGPQHGSRGVLLTRVVSAHGPWHQSLPVFTHHRKSLIHVLHGGASHCAMASKEVTVWSDRTSLGTWGGGSSKGYTLRS